MTAHTKACLLVLVQNGNTALGIAQRLGYISVVDTLRVVTEEIITTTTVCHKHRYLNVFVVTSTFYIVYPEMNVQC